MRVKSEAISTPIPSAEPAAGRSSITGCVCGIAIDNWGTSGRIRMTEQYPKMMISAEMVCEEWIGPYTISFETRRETACLLGNEGQSAEKDLEQLEAFKSSLTTAMWECLTA